VNSMRFQAEWTCWKCRNMVRPNQEPLQNQTNKRGTTPPKSRITVNSSAPPAEEFGGGQRPSEINSSAARADELMLCCLIHQATVGKPECLTNKFGVEVTLENLESIEFRMPGASSGQPSEMAGFMRGDGVPIPDNDLGSFKEMMKYLPGTGKTQAREVRAAFQNSLTGKVDLSTSHMQGANQAARKELLKAVENAHDLYEMCMDELRSARDNNRQPKSQAVFVSGMVQWVKFCVELGRNPFRWAWILLDDMSAVQRNQEDGLFSLYVGFLKVKVSTLQTIENCLSVVRTFHKDHLGLSAPPMPGTDRWITLVGKQLMDQNPFRRQRDYATPDELRAIAKSWEDQAMIAYQNENDEATFYYLSLIAFHAAAFTGGHRTGNLAPGDLFDSNKCWCMSTLEGFSEENMNLHSPVEERTLMIPPPQNKTWLASKSANERAQEALPYTLKEGDIMNFGFAARRAIQHFPTLIRGVNVSKMRENTHSMPAFGYFKLTTSSSQHSSGLKFVAFSEKDIRDHLETAAIVSLASGGKLKITDHVYRKSQNAAGQAAGIPADVRAAMAGRVDGAKGVGTGDYDENVISVTMKAMEDMASVEFTAASRHSLSKQGLSGARQNPQSLAALKLAHKKPERPLEPAELGLDTSQNTEVDPTPAPAPMASSEEETFFCSPGEELRARRSPQIEALGKPASMIGTVQPRASRTQGQAGKPHPRAPRKSDEDINSFVSQAKNAQTRILVPDSDEEVSATDEEESASLEPDSTEESDSQNGELDEGAQQSLAHNEYYGEPVCPKLMAMLKKRSSPQAAMTGIVSPVKTRSSAILSAGQAREDLWETIKSGKLIDVTEFQAAPETSVPLAEVPIQQLHNLLTLLKQQELCIKTSKISGAGAGVFTTGDRRPTLSTKPALSYTGKTFTEEEWKVYTDELLEDPDRMFSAPFSNVGETMTPYAIELTGGEMVDAEQQFDNVLRYIQHAHQCGAVGPNCNLTEIIFDDTEEKERFPILAQESHLILSGTELFIDYTAAPRIEEKPRPKRSIIRSFFPRKRGNAEVSPAPRTGTKLRKQ
jgi:hypothetical protein